MDRKLRRKKKEKLKKERINEERSEEVIEEVIEKKGIVLLVGPAHNTDDPVAGRR